MGVSGCGWVHGFLWVGAWVWVGGCMGVGGWVLWVWVGVGGCLLNYVPTSCLTVYRNAGIDYNDPEYWTQGFRYTCKADGSLAIPNFLQAVAEPVSGAPAVDLHQCVQGDLLCTQTTPVHVSVQIMSAGKSLALVHSVSAVSVSSALLTACTH